MSFATFLSRALAWLRRNPAARADALELTASALRTRADALELRGQEQHAVRVRGRAAVLERRARQLRPAPRRPGK